MARASTVIGLTMLGAAGVGAATIPFMGSGSSSASAPQGVAGGLRCAAHRFPTVAECQAAGHPACRPDGTMFVPATCTTSGTTSSGSRWYNSHPIYWFGGGRSGTTTGSGTPQSVTTSTRPGGSTTTTTTTGGTTSQRGGFGGSVSSHGGSSGSS